ncbi:HNH endonuclease [Aquincola sp. J276]|uniref:HNH endonuclease n=1 Tax=Aquincola sp. J276 TaxID=2898432 RepID=UPI002150EC18|nr:HNH endonuclease signature motif containing protein [Aquincola sp. J276]MCR5864663.1 HNH endonuclease [Aquincola sp. J276]
MPQAAPRPCTQVGCGVLVRDGSGRCAAHKVVAGAFADRRRGSRHERGYGTAWDKQRKRILQRDAGICQACLPGAVHAGTEVDHRVPKAEGGSDDDANLQTICRAAHQEKTAAEAARGRGVQSSAPLPPGPIPSPNFCARRFQGWGGSSNGRPGTVGQAGRAESAGGGTAATGR